MALNATAVRLVTLLITASSLELIAAGCAAGSSTENQPATGTPPSELTVLTNARVYTVDESAPWVDSFAYDGDGVIIAVGTDPDVRATAGENATVIDAGGRLVLPGFQDPHVHVPEAGINIELCFLPDSMSLDAYEEMMVDCANEHPGSDWVRAAGASLFDLRSTDELPIDVLDRAIPDRPALVLDDLGHAVWTNTLGLQAAGIESNDGDPQGGVLHRSAEGRLTGLLLEDAQQLVRNAAAPDDDTVYRGLLIALDDLARHGVTTTSDAGGYWLQNHPAAWERAEAEGKLTVRAHNTLYVYPTLDIDEQLAEFERRFRSEPGSLLRFDTAKLYIDGIVDLGTASLIEPYDVAVDENYPSGFDYFTTEALFTYVNELHALGFRINFHAIGDQAVRDALDAVEAIEDSPQAIAGRRHRTTHTYLVDPDDLGRFADIGVVADMQHSPDAIAADYHEFLAEFIGDRAFDLIPTAQLIEADATVTLSSDWDAGPLSPLGTIERALTRKSNAVPDVDTAVALATIEAAYALGHDDVTGSIEVGKYADFVVLDQNIFDIADIDATETLLTVVGGDVVYRADGFTR